jgi:phosphatidate cytidylyltransferase
MKRLLTALALVPVIVWVVLWAPPWAFLIVLSAVALLCFREYDQLAASFGFGAPGPLGYLLGLAFLLWREDTGLLLVAGALLAFILAMRETDLAKSLPRSALLVTGVVYIFGCWRCAVAVRGVNPHWLLFALSLNWVGDSAAYYVGRSLGKHRLAPRVSPKKTWEGALASAAAAALLGALYVPRFAPQVSIPLAILVAVAANAAGQLGDLSESAMKRGAGIKDSGALLPGHGGLLDRVDSSLFALPVILLFLKLVR